MAHPNFKTGVGGFALDRYDADKHFNGLAFRHNALQIDVNPALTINGAQYITVADALAALANVAAVEQSGGQGFVAVGDGYDTWHNANGIINFDPTVPALDTLLNPIFTMIRNGQMPPAPFNRVFRGGIILIKAGTYIVQNTINIPAGIILIGEGYGTKIVNATSLVINSVGIAPSPKPSPTPAAVFEAMQDLNRSVNDGAIDSVNMFMFGRQTAIYNMVIADNFVENTILGDLNYKLPQNQTSATALNPPPLVAVQRGANLTLENVYGIGRATYSTPPTITAVSGSFVALDVSVADSNTYLKLNNCFIDGFSIPVKFQTSGNTVDYLDIRNSRIRAYGYWNGDSSAINNNSFCVSATCNICVENNFLYGNSSNLQAILAVSSVSGSPNLQARGKIVITGNQIVIDRSSNTTNSTFQIYNTPAGFDTVASAISYGNVFQDTFDVKINTAIIASLNENADNNSFIDVGNISAAGNVNIQSANITSGIAIPGPSSLTYATPQTKTYIRSALSCIVSTPTTGSGWDSTVGYYLVSYDAGTSTFINIPPHQGATLQSVSISFTVNTTAGAWTVVPSTFPSIEGFAENLSTLASLDLNSGGAITYPTETIGTWTNGAVKTLTITCNQNNVIDNNHMYSLRLIDSSGGTGSAKTIKWHYVQFNYGNITTAVIPL